MSYELRATHVVDCSQLNVRRFYDLRFWTGGARVSPQEKLRQLELNGDLVVDRHRPAVQLKGLVTPLPYGAGGRLGEQRLAARYLHPVHVAIFSHQNVEHDWAFYSLQTRFGWVNRLYFVCEPTTADSLRDRNRYKREHRLRVYHRLGDGRRAGSSHRFREVGSGHVHASSLYGTVRRLRRGRIVCGGDVLWLRRSRRSAAGGHDR